MPILKIINLTTSNIVLKSFDGITVLTHKAHEKNYTQNEIDKAVPELETFKNKNLLFYSWSNEDLDVTGTVNMTTSERLEVQGHGPRLVYDTDLNLLFYWKSTTQIWETLRGKIKHRIIVAKKGGDFDKIQDAIDSITILTNETYIIEIYPGIYVENIVLKNGINLIGMGSNLSIIITSNSGITLSFIGSFCQSHISNITIQNNAFANTDKCMVCVTGVFLFLNVIFDYNLINTYGNAIEFTGAGIIIFNNGNFIDINHAGTQGGIIRGILKTGSADFFGTTSLIDIETEGTLIGDNIICFDDQTNTTELGEFYLSNFNVNLEFKNINSAGDIIFYNSTNNGFTKTLIKNNEILIHATNGLGHIDIYHLNSGGASKVILSTNNTIDVHSFAIEHFTHIDDALDIIDSRFDILNYTDISLVSEVCLGNGKTHFVTSPDLGDIQISGVIVPIVLSLTSDYLENESWIFDIMRVNTNLNNLTVQLPDPSRIVEYKEGGIKFLFNIGSHLLFIDPNGIPMDSNLSIRQLRPGGYVELQKTEGKLKIIREKDLSIAIIPTDLLNLEIWLDLNDDTTITETGGLISAIESKDNHLPLRVCSGTLLERPTLNIGGLNSKNTAIFNGSNHLNFGDIEVHNNTRGLHVFIITKIIAINDSIIGKYQTFGNNREWYLGTSEAKVYDSGVPAPVEIANISPSLNDWQLIEMSWEPGGNVRTYINSFLQSTSSGTINDILDTTSELWFGGTQDTDLFLGEIAELTIYSNRLSNINRGNLINYLIAKWNLSNVPVLSSVNFWNRNSITNTISPDIANDNLNIGTGEMIAEILTINSLIKAPVLTTAPVNPNEGWIYMNNTIHKLQVYNGTIWEDLN